MRCRGTTRSTTAPSRKITTSTDDVAAGINKVNARFSSGAKPFQQTISTSEVIQAPPSKEEAETHTTETRLNAGAGRMPHQMAVHTATRRNWLGPRQI